MYCGRGFKQEAQQPKAALAGLWSLLFIPNKNKRAAAGAPEMRVMMRKQLLVKC